MTILEQLQEEYKQADLHPKKEELVTDEETCIFLNEHLWFWPWLFGIAFIGGIIFVGVVGQ